MAYVNPTGEFQRDQRYIPTRVTEDGRDGYPVEPGRYRLIVSRACPWANRAIIVRRLLGLEDVLSMGVAGPTHDERSWTFDLDPGGRDPVLGIERLQEAFFARFPDYDKGITVPAIVDVADRAGRHQRLRADHASTCPREWREVPPAGRAGAVPGAPARRDRQGQQRASSRTSTTASTGPDSPGTQEAYEKAYHRLFDRLDKLSELLAGPALPGRRHDHRGRRTAVHHARALRRGLPRALQVQSAQAHRDAGALGLRPRPLPDARLRRHDRLRRHQAALLHRSPGHQSDRHRAGRPRPGELADRARSRAARRTAVRGRHSPAAAEAGRGGAGRTRRRRADGPQRRGGRPHRRFAGSAQVRVLHDVVGESRSGPPAASPGRAGRWW